MEAPMWSTDRSINIVTVLAILALVTWPFTKGIALLVVAALLAGAILVRAWWLENEPSQKFVDPFFFAPRTDFTMSVTSDRLKVGLPDWNEEPAEPAPSTEEVVKANINYNRSKREPQPESIKDVLDKEDATFTPPWLDKFKTRH